VPQTLLLADDSVTIQRVIELTFADEDINVVAVSDGDSAIARLDNVPPDIVLVDVGMPGKNGYDVAAYVKQSPRLAHIPVVLLTGAFEPVDEVKASGAGCDGVLAKPFEPHQVIGRVKELLSRPPRTSAAADVLPAAEAPLVVEAHTPDPKSIDDYFDQLDAAFSNLATRQPSTVESVPAEIDWFGLKHAAPSTAPSVEVPLAPPAASEAFESPVEEESPSPLPSIQAPAVWMPPLGSASTSVLAPEPVAAPALSIPPAPSTAPAAPIVPPLADAFAALLDAERGGHQTAPSTWPVSAATPMANDDELVERVSRRVLEQLTDRVVRETVATLAERLIRDEIDRLKKTIE
jgi:CheY-like chemotaxis protein